MQRLTYFMVGLGVGLIALGFASAHWALPPIWLLAVAFPLLVGVGLGYGALAWKRETRRRQAYQQTSPLVEFLIPQLFGDYSPYVIETAQSLRAIRDSSAVPALLLALEQTVNARRPGWNEVAEALIEALGTIGDRRALMQLSRLERHPEIGGLPALRTAIDAIEPQASLLRPLAEPDRPESLLRPAEENVPASEETTLLLHPVRSDTR